MVVAAEVPTVTTYVPTTIISTRPQSLKLLEVLAAKAELTWRLPSTVIFEYWLKVLSVTVHRAMANSIVSRARTLTTRGEVYGL